MNFRTNFLKCIVVRAVWNVLQPQISVINIYGQQLNLSQVSNKVTSSVDKEKLLKKYFHHGYSYVALIMTAVADVLKSCGAFYR